MKYFALALVCVGCASTPPASIPVAHQTKGMQPANSTVQNQPVNAPTSAEPNNDVATRQSERRDAQAYVDLIDGDMKQIEESSLNTTGNLPEIMSGSNDTEAKFALISSEIDKSFNPFILRAKNYKPVPLAAELHGRYISYLGELKEYFKGMMRSTLYKTGRPIEPNFSTSVIAFCDKYSVVVPQRFRLKSNPSDL